jgi:sortase A
LERVLWVVAALGIGWFLVAQLEGRLYQAREEALLEERLAASRPAPAPPGGPASATAPSVAGRPSERPAERSAVRPAELPGEEEPSPASPVPPGSAFGRLAIPRLGLSVVVAGGADKRTLRRAVGHIPGTALPGEAGNVGLAGHRDRYFRPLKDVQLADEITLTTPEGTFRYRVEWAKVVERTAVHVLDATAAPALTLVTCYPFYYVGPAPKRFIVRARQVGHEPPAVAGAAP